ncbi:MAG: hypothetical protein COV67_00695 [Nitrospinae bacterium CG11_big_fil_rev_8_21_14_0_20_56_8]|nr:MAG: hypothetical protein COV67_00695 [Nitrospinae bacterium CG11_big_fil_rev_8_21_14_0_20_56_8]
MTRFPSRFAVRGKQASFARHARGSQWDDRSFGNSGPRKRPEVTFFFHPSREGASKNFAAPARDGAPLFGISNKSFQRKNFDVFMQAISMR